MTPTEGTPIPRVGAEPNGAGGGSAFEEHPLRRELSRLRGRVAQLEREKLDIEAFAAVAAHELMEPLVVIEVHAAMLTQGPPEHAAMSADGIGRAAGRLRRLVETILLDAKAGEEGITPRRVDLQRVLDAVIALLGPEIVAREAKVVSGPMPTVPGDEALLGGLLTNLVTNALKYGRREHATITIGARRDGEEWLFTVADDGAPIPASERELIFEPFQRAQRERRARGAGLGLAICRRIVARHGGRIGLEPQQTGNCFYFTLPA